MTWRNFAACLAEDPDLFFPTGNGDSAYLQIEKAQVVCGRCAVVEACLGWAMASRQIVGVWGGLSDDQRLALKGHDARLVDPVEPRPRRTERI